ncbi:MULTISPECIES: hypothetical protein [Crocosphaera]|uniref:hypothetical protein n=1 Tax=Crocosphaera TaxID=263510 RepID=UPI00056728DF|nr:MULTISPECIES: hypothetical protein [Crocosphaera]MCH2244815.1 hypothetical protein [Crocosphaera sp.]
MTALYITLHYLSRGSISWMVICALMFIKMMNDAPWQQETVIHRTQLILSSFEHWLGCSFCFSDFSFLS